jgi:hypothetical protein
MDFIFDIYAGRAAVIWYDAYFSGQVSSKNQTTYPFAIA